jgi:hypothetical protein
MRYGEVTSVIDYMTKNLERAFRLAGFDEDE